MNMRARLNKFWSDEERRRSLLISLGLHLMIFLLLLIWSNRVPVEPAEQFIVIDVGTPAFSELQTDAATVGDPAAVAADFARHSTPLRCQ